MEALGSVYNVHVVYEFKELVDDVRFMLKQLGIARQLVMEVSQQNTQNFELGFN